MDSTIIAAAISGIIAFLGILASALISRIQLRNEHILQSQEIEIKTKEIESQLEQQIKDFELRTQELEIVTKQLRAEYESFRQSQYVEVLRKRIEIYPDIWSILTRYMINWQIEGKPQNYEWACELLNEINEFNASAGAFFSQDFYKRFVSFRQLLIKIKLRDNKVISIEDLNDLNQIYYGSPTSSGLSAILKDDLGSYGDAAIQQRSLE